MFLEVYSIASYNIAYKYSLSKPDRATYEGVLAGQHASCLGYFGPNTKSKIAI